MRFSFLVVFAFFSFFALNCQKEGAIAKITMTPKKEVKTFSFDFGKAKKVLESINIKSKLKLQRSIRIEDCHLYFEPGGEIGEKFPIEKVNDVLLSVEELLAGCAAEATLLNDKHVYIAYGFPSDVLNARNLRVLKFDRKTGEKIWSHEMDRTENSKNYIANFRGSFLTPLKGKLFCAGTLWEGGTQTICIDEKTKEKIWDGRISSWSGIDPVGSKNGLYIAGLSSLTKHYPFSGTEMEYLKLAGTGGRAAFYKATSEGLFFSPSRTLDTPFLYYYSFHPLELKWKLALPVRPEASVGEFVKTDAKNGGVLVLRLKEKLVGVSVEGKTLWQYDLGPGRPSLAVDKDKVLMIFRQKSKPNILIKMDALRGEIESTLSLDPGSLSVLRIGNSVFIKGVRALRKIESE